MRAFIGMALLTTTLLSTAGVAHAMPRALTEPEMDQVSAGGQYSVAAGGGTAQLGTVSVQTVAGAASTTFGMTLTMANLKVSAAGAGLDVYGYGASGAGDSQSSVYGQASADRGRITILVTTISIARHNGDAMTQSWIRVIMNGSGRALAGAGTSL